jgi:plasmid stabilization system protein ParE
MQITFPSPALEELAKGALYYEHQRAGLGFEFLEEVDAFVRIIAAAPERPRLRHRGYRRVNLKRFPYYIAYSIESEVIVVLAIGHGSRRPEYWIEREQ